ASPTTQLSFRGIAPASLGTISVRGSRSGTHAGRIRAHSDGQGASWIPRKRFASGETVTVRTGLNLRNAHAGDFRLRIMPVPEPGARQPHGGAPPPRPPAPRPPPAARHRLAEPPADRARLRLPQRQAEEGPEAERADDRRQRRTARVVPAAAAHPGGDRLPRP